MALNNLDAATVMAYVGIDANDDGDGTAPTVRAAVETPMGSPAGHQTDKEPPGAVYQKNGAHLHLPRMSVDQCCMSCDSLPCVASRADCLFARYLV